MPLSAQARTSIKDGLSALFPGGAIDDGLVDQFVEQLQRTESKGDLQRLGLPPAPLGVTPLTAAPTPAAGERFYVAHARHSRKAPPFSDFTGHLPVVRVTLAADGAETIATGIGEVLQRDHLLFNLREVSKQFGVGRTLGYDPQRVELVTPARMHHRFAAVAVFLCYRNANDTVPSSFIFEAGLAQGAARVLYACPTLDGSIVQQTGYNPTPTSKPSHWYRGRLKMNGDELQGIEVAASPDKDGAPYITITVDFERVAEPPKTLPIQLFVEAGMRVASIANAIGQTVPDMKSPIVQHFMGVLGQALQWHAWPQSGDVAAKLDANAPKTTVRTAGGEREWECVELDGPKNIDQLAQQLASVGKPGFVSTARARGALHSCSDAPTTRGVLFDMRRSNAEVTPVVPGRQLNSTNTDRMVEIGAGASIDSVNQTLESWGLSLPAMGNYTGQTFVGAMSTGTHGCSLSQGALPTMVRSILLVDGNGKKWRLEPKRRPFSKEAEPGVELRVDDDWFDAALVSLGALGVIWSVIVETVPTFYMVEDRRQTTWSAVKAELLAGKPESALLTRPGLETATLDGWSISLNTYANPSGDHSAVSFNWYKVKRDQCDGLGDARECFFQQLGSWIGQDALQKLWVDHPEQVPHSIDLGFTSQLAYGARTIGDMAHRIMGRTFGGHPPFGFGTEVALPFQFGDSPDAKASREKLVQAVEKVFEVVADQRKAERLYLRGYIAIRFVQGCTAMLASSAEHPVACIEMVTMSGGMNVVTQNVTLAGRLEKALEPFGGRPHLGLNTTLMATDFRKLWPRAEQFLAVRMALDPRHVFDNELTRKLGLDF